MHPTRRNPNTYTPRGPNPNRRHPVNPAAVNAANEARTRLDARQARAEERAIACGCGDWRAHLLLDSGEDRT